jgi:hypothetical protein
MSQAQKPKADANGVNANTEPPEAKKKELDYTTIFQRGVMTLCKPLLSADVEISELRYDFSTLTGEELVRALDSEAPDRTGERSGVLTNKQAIRLFIYAAKNNGGLDEHDLQSRMGVQDMVGASLLAKNFFKFLVLQASNNIRNW